MADSETITDKELKDYDHQQAETQTEIKSLPFWLNNMNLNDEGTPKVRSVHNAQVCVEELTPLKDKIRLNKFSGLVEISSNLKIGNYELDAGSWSDRYYSIIRQYIEENTLGHDLVFSKEFLQDAVDNIASKHSYHPVKQYIESKQWDGIPRAEALFVDYLGAENTAYNRQVARLMLSGGIARIYQPGVKFDTAVVLVGPQGVGKSSLLDNLAAGKWFTDSLQGMGKDKDDYVQLQGNWIVELSELSAMRKSGIEDVKRFLSARSDKFRDPYGRGNTDHPRQNIIVGTTNNPQFLSDLTGGRRFLPVTCGRNRQTKNPYKPDPENIQQIWAEAKVWYDTGENLYLSDEMEKEAENQRGQAQIEDDQLEAINNFLNMLVPLNWENMDDWNKRSYFDKYVNGQKDNSTDLKKPLEETCTLEVLRVVFNKKMDEISRGRQTGLTFKVNTALNNMPGWKDNKHYVYRGKERRGIKRIAGI